MAQITTPAGITLEYETAGSETDPPLLMVSGFGAQLVAWPRGFCQRLAAGGRFVISFDNHDCGLSSKLDGRLVDMDAINAAAAAGDFERARSLAPYTLDEMAADGIHPDRAGRLHRCIRTGTDLALAALARRRRRPSGRGRIV
jgi:pimeloyl-ACP methyl ester carboxylesterase